MNSTLESERVIPAFHPQSARGVFYNLFSGEASSSDLAKARCFAAEQIEEASALDTDLPNDRRVLYAWMEQSVQRVGEQYREYLEERKAGGARRYFRNKAHALYFLRGVAPTKLVDGAWLYGLLGHWQDARFSSLIQTYLEELGEGLTSKNHVRLYKKLLASQGIDRWDDLSDEHYTQGAIQLALAHNAECFLPEIIGYNLGYEQLPLHLLITAYELKELRIDPYYFTLHVTVDNADSGHAKKAVDAIFQTLPRLSDAGEWYRRVRNGYNLNFLGESTLSVIDSFDIDEEMISIFVRKGMVGQYAHSDGRRVDGRTVNDWLSAPDEIGNFLEAMQKEGWFVRHQDPQKSRFWRLIQSEKAKMFGVFSAYEQQVIYDWIRGDSTEEYASARSIRLPQKESTFDARHKLMEAADVTTLATSENDFDAELLAFEQKLATSNHPQQAIERIIDLMSPALHHTEAGLAATRIFNAVCV